MEVVFFWLVVILGIINWFFKDEEIILENNSKNANNRSRDNYIFFMDDPTH